jgi:hypothetical protein
MPFGRIRQEPNPAQGSHASSDGSGLIGFAAAEEEAGGVHMLAAEARSATALKARLRWRQHGRLSARHDALWQQQTLRVMCGSFNCKGKTIARKLSLHLS